jgi:hypothetical protein
MAKRRKKTAPALAYLRTSSATNIGADKDSEKRQRAAIEAFAKRAGFEIVACYYDEAVSGADRIEERPGFADLLEHLEGTTASKPSSWKRLTALRAISLCKRRAS